MIRSFRHRGLRLLHERGDNSRIHAVYRSKVARILGYLDVARQARDMDLPGLRLHPLTGNMSGFGAFRYRATGVSYFDLRAVTSPTLTSSIITEEKLCRCLVRRIRAKG
jgi:proteic killer suppression protein